MIAIRWRTFTHRATRLGLLVAFMLLAACNRATPPPELPTAIPEIEIPTVELPTVTVAPATPTLAADVPTPESNGPETETGASSDAESASGSATLGAIFTSPRYSYTVVLPCCWLALPTPGTAVESALAELDAGDDIPLWGDLGERLREREGGAVLELLALLPDGDNLALPIAQMTVSVLPTFGLTLDDYASATAAELTRIANTTVQSVHVEPSLGVGGFPASVIEYIAVPTPATPENADQSMAGLQVAFFGHDGASLIVLTFTTAVDRFAELQPEFLHIVRSVSLHDLSN